MNDSTHSQEDREKSTYDLKSMKNKHPLLLAFILIFSILSVLYVFNIYSFLAMNKPVHGEILIIEGWIPRTFLEEASTVFGQGSYNLLIIIGSPSEEQADNSLTHQFKKELVLLGVPEEKIKIVPVGQSKGSRTFSRAKAASLWLSKITPPVEKVDVFTASVHGRKSRLLYKRALGETVQVGIISGGSAKAGGAFWVRSKYMIYRVLRNTVGYVDAVLFTY